ncbi:hypothetical protein F2Q69_00009817 [Brassica cretica]|uniref:Uncharacterized protein n=1 Tax=Brassica cretica TaxID=69181 RepID=A0A8S9P4R5_BRACR|nr:hypothetical protein F2Q69_00009817 [Brassica cretica]
MSSSFSFPRLTTTIDDLEDLYKTYRVGRAVVLDLAGATETPKTVREGYCGVYLSFFHSGGRIFLVPGPILEILVELGLSLTQILPNFLRYLIAFLVRAREEGLSFGLSEFRQLVLVKRNQQNPGTFLVSPRPGRHVIEDIPYRDEKWREQFFVFKMDRVSMGEFKFSRLPRSWAENIAPSGSSSMSDGIRGLIGILRGGPLWLGGYEDEAEHSQEVVATPSVQAQSSDRLTRQLVRRSSFRTSRSASMGRASGKSPLISIQDSDDESASKERRSLVSLSPSSEDETIAATRKRRRSSKGALPSPSRPRFVPEGDGSLFTAQGEKEAYAKVMEAFNEYVVVTEDHVVTSRNDKEIESIGSEIMRLLKEFKVTKREGKKDAEKTKALTEDWKRIHQENEALMTHRVAQKARIAALEVERDRDIRRASRVARRDIATHHREILESLKDKNMSLRRSNPCDSDRVRTRTGSANAERIRSEDVSEALTEVLRLEGHDRPPKKAKTNGSVHSLGVSGEAAVAKPFYWQFSHSKDCPITEDPDSVAHLVRHFKPAGGPLPSLRNMTEREAYEKMVVAHSKAMEANNEFAAALEKCLQDVPRSGELYEIKKVVRELKLGLKMALDRERANAAQLGAAEKLGNQAASLEARMRVVSNRRKLVLEKASFLEAKVESSANKFSDDLRRATYDAKRDLANSYLDVLVSLKEKWEKKKAATDCEARLREVMANIDLLKKIMNNNLLASDELLRFQTKEVELGSELDVMAISDFSVGKLDLPHILEDLP